MAAKHEKVSIGRLKGIKVLFEDDLYQLAQLVLKGHDATDVGTNRVSRHPLLAEQGEAVGFKLLDGAALRP